MRIEPTLRCEHHACIGEAGSQAKRHPSYRLYEGHMEKGHHRSDGRKSSEGSDMANRNDDPRQYERACCEPHEVERHHRADRTAREALVASSHDQERAQQAIAQQQRGDAQQQRPHWCENEPTFTRCPYGIDCAAHFLARCDGWCSGERRIGYEFSSSFTSRSASRWKSENTMRPPASITVNQGVPRVR